MANYLVSYFGQNFVLDNEQVNEWVAENIPLRDTFPFSPYRRPGEYQIGLSYPLAFPDFPFVEVGKFFYPTGMTRFGWFHGVMTSTELAGVTSALSAGSTAGDLVFTQGDTTLTFENFYLLPPKPLAKFGSLSGLFLVTVVDDRYLAFYSNTGAPDPDVNLDSWNDFYEYLASQLGIELTIDDVPTAYVQPDIDSDNNAWYENAALVLDSTAYNTGMNIVRLWDGSYYAETIVHSLEQITTNIAAMPPQIAGGNVFANPVFGNAVLPSSVVVTFPLYCTDSQMYQNQRWQHAGYPIQVGDLYSVTVNLSSIAPEFLGFAGTKTFHDTYKALVTSDDITPTNGTQLTALATQVATDYYNTQISSWDVVFPGIVSWTPDGLNDMIINWKDGVCSTRIVHKPWNFMVEELLHGDGGDYPPNGCNFSGCLGPLVANVFCSGPASASVQVVDQIWAYFNNGNFLATASTSGCSDDIGSCTSGCGG